MMIRDYNNEALELNGRSYNYDFDEIVRQYMMHSFEDFMPNGRALEMGCYKGESTVWLSQKYENLTVIEAASDLVKDAKIKVGGKVRFFCDTFENIILEEKFDAIFLINTLEHLDDPLLVMRKIKGWLTPKGRLFILVPNAQAPSRQIAVKMGLISHNASVTEAERKNGHRNTFSFDTLEEIVKRAAMRAKHRGGIIFKALANYQFDLALKHGIIDHSYVDGCYQLGMQYPELCASIYVVCEAAENE